MWFAHPNYKHGRYSKYSGIPEREKAEKKRKKRMDRYFKERAELEARLGRELTDLEFLSFNKSFFEK